MNLSSSPAPASCAPLQAPPPSGAHTGRPSGGFPPMPCGGVFSVIIQPRRWLDDMVAQLGAVGLGPESCPLGVALAGDLVLVYVEDPSGDAGFVTPSRLAALGCNLDDVHARALAGLASHLPRLRVNGGCGRYRVRLDDHGESSMVLLLDQWRHLFEVRGEPVVLMAALDHVTITGSDDEDSVAALHGMAQSVAARAPHPLSGQRFVWRAGRLQSMDA